MAEFEMTFSYIVIYVFRINDKDHEGLMKIGKTTLRSEKKPDQLPNNSNELNEAAKKRIREYTQTAGTKFELLHTELGILEDKENGKTKLKSFSDHDVHTVLKRSGIKNHYFDTQNKANEWFKIDLETAKNAIKAVKEKRLSLYSNEISRGKNPVIFRPEQEKAIHDTLLQFKKGNRMLWNAKMRFGKTLTALQVAKLSKFKKTIILTHRPVVKHGWYEDFNKIFYDTDYVYGSKTEGESIENLVDTDKNFVYFASMQDLRGSQAVGGKFDKNDYIFLLNWDFIVLDEAHEGMLTKMGQAVIDELCNQEKEPKVLRLSGTPFNLLDQFKEEEIYTWDYVMEQKAKREWDSIHFGDPNPYSELPEMEIYTYNLNKLIFGYLDDEDQAFNFREFFRTWTGSTEKDFRKMPENAKIGDFVHENDVMSFLNLLCKSDSESNYPFSKNTYRNYFRHTLWIVPGVKEAKALSALLHRHEVFGSGVFNIVNVAGDGDEEVNYKDALTAVQDAIGEDPDESMTITISCGRLTTGVSVPEWTAVFILSGTYSTSASAYMQTIFRVQTPANINGKIKEKCCVFDFAPDRTLKMIAEVGKLSSRNNSSDSERAKMGEFLNFCPVIGIDGSKMSYYNVDSLLQQLKKAYTDRVVKNGFDDNHLYNDNLLKLDQIELREFEELKGIVKSSKQTKKQGDIDINHQGLTNEEYELLEKLGKKPKKDLTPDEQEKLKERKEQLKNAATARSILRAISIRIPLLVYGADVPLDQEITIDNFTDLVDDASWTEFMPNEVTKDLFKKFSKYYDKDIFTSASRSIRQQTLAADKLSPTERVKKIVNIFNTFKNPDKETVLTPWRVVNLHLSKTLGGYDFYDEKHEEMLEGEPRFIDNGKITQQTVSNLNTHILEINSKSGLYPLYLTYSIYVARTLKLKDEELTIEKQRELWLETVRDNIFVICKTPMAKAITKRTLLGYNTGKLNAHSFDNLNKQIREGQKLENKIKRGSFWKKENSEMTFDAIVGNPPYQETVDSSVNDKPIYNLFMDLAFELSKKVSFITPARFLFNAGATPKDWNEKILEDEHFKLVLYEPNSENIFPNVDIKGGVAITLRDEDSNFGKIGILYSFPELGSIKEKVWAISKESFADIVKNRGLYRYSDLFYKEHPEIDEKNKKRDTRISTSAFDRLPLLFTDEKPNDGHEYIRFLGKERNKQRTYKWFRKDYFIPVENLYKYKVILPKSNGTGAIGEVLSTPLIGEPLIGYTETFISAGDLDSKEEAEHILRYLKTKFARAMLGILKVTQDNTQGVWKFVPMQNFTSNSDIDWDKSIKDIDKQLYKKYQLDQNEIDFIESKVQEMR